MGSASKQSNPTGKQPKPGSKAAQQADRRARIAELRAVEQRRERRNKLLTIGISSALVLAMIGGGTWLALDAKQKSDDKKAAAAAEQKAKEDAANVPIDGVQTFGKLTQNHVQTDVKYPQTPPVGGDHNPVWATCMGNVYDKPLKNENAVHSLEHGAVWVTYNGKATPADIQKLGDKVKATPYSMMSPYPDEAGTITLSAWSTQLVVESADDPRVAQFFTKYVQGPQTLEQGASCSSGTM
ncbi:DUF3105 domain-containing protein [Streptomyces sp. TLI_171]|uniref:DUF3105 domain-containing protein n=1 Tax=Streptomyces sp. TLI_171 TaxID=1938859 RepID=UPI000C1A02B6|nr:DUF3105 domain-containing protein [Streptomyces sp. TLI_171]RKE18504.1 uncharacterized protein DUF3105 [Streptomyces sp. TLI_171]